MPRAVVTRSVVDRDPGRSDHRFRADALCRE